MKRSCLLIALSASLCATLSTPASADYRHSHRDFISPPKVEIPASHGLNLQSQNEAPIPTPELSEPADIELLEELNAEALSPETLTTPRIAIIIDDIGNALESGQKAVFLPGPVTLSVLPMTPQAKRLATEGHEQGKEIMVHTPMSNLSNAPLGPGALTEQLSEHDFLETLRQGIAAVPHATGVNNHMGSQLTQQQEPMNWLMSELKQQSLYFVDSLTSAQSLAGKTAHQQGLKTISRDIFLDTFNDPEFIQQQYQKLLKKAKQRGYALAIGHPYPATLALLQEKLPLLEAQGIKLVSVSQLMTFQKQQERLLQLAKREKSQKKTPLTR
ncbi:MAG: divergent polysaccharide deacetylase family protein [Cellvibrionaceae bacterium]